MLNINYNDLRAIKAHFKQSGNESWILLFPGGAGDTYLVSTLLSAFFSTHNVFGRPLNLVLSHRQSFIPRMFSFPHQMLSITNEERIWVQCRLWSPPPFFDPDHPYPLHPSFIGDGDNIRLMEHPNFTVLDVFRFVLKIPFESSAELPIISNMCKEEAELFANKMGILRGESAILFPSSRTIPSPKFEFWIQLANKLSSSGLKVFCNRLPGETCIPGTFPIDFPLNIAIPLCNYAGFTVSTLTGTAQITSTSSASKAIVILHEDKSTLIQNQNGLVTTNDNRIWTMKKIGLPFSGTEFFVSNTDNFFIEASRIVSSLLAGY